MRLRTFLGLTAAGVALWAALRPKDAGAAERPAKPEPPGVPPRVPPRAPELPPWPAPADLPSVPDVPPADARPRPQVSRNLSDLFLRLRSPADPPFWLLYATAELGGGLTWAPLPAPSAGHYPPMGLTAAQVAELFPILRDSPNMILAALEDPEKNVRLSAALLRRYYDQAVALLQAVPGQGDLDDLAHIVRIAWLYGPAAFDLFKVWRDVPSWYIEAKPGDLSQAEAWERSWRRWAV